MENILELHEPASEGRVHLVDELGDALPGHPVIIGAADVFLVRGADKGVPSPGYQEEMPARGVMVATTLPSLIFLPVMMWMPSERLRVSLTSPFSPVPE